MRDYLKEVFPEYRPQHDRDASLKFALGGTSPRTGAFGYFNIF
jgi:hypothetical protein